MIRQSLILLPSLLLCILSARGQHLVLDSYGGEATVSATESITLTSGFHVPLGSTFRAYITESSAPVLVGAIPSGDRNYVITYVTKRAGISNPADPTLTTADVMPVIQYYDGLGRPVQRVQVKGSPSFKDLVQYQAYDVYGREIKQYLPYAEQNSTDGSFKTDALNNLVSYYSASSWDPYAVKTAYPFAETVFESSPLDRVLQQGAPGSVWQPLNSSIVGSGHTVQSGYGTNTANSVRLWNITGSGADGSSFYGKGELYKTTLTDENGNRTIEYKDKEGRVVLKQAEEVAGSFFNTYYVYDDFGQLRYVIPPGVAVTSFSEGDTEFNQFIYAYRYDGRKRVVEKKVPGKAWEYMVYNPLDQLVLTQDGNQRTSNQWTFQKYDAFGRVVITGLVVSGSGRAVHQTAVDGQSALWEVRNNADAVTGYSNSAYPTTGISSFLTINYYDDYSFFGNSFGGPTGSQSLRVQGLLTGTKVNVLGSGAMLLTSHYYDDEGRVIQTKSQNHLGGADTVTNTYSFTNELLTSHREHTTPGGSVTIANRYEYDHAGRRLEAYQKMNSDAEVLLSKNIYNEIGQLRRKELHNGLQGTDYSYNSRGWLKSSTSPQFSMQLTYEDGSTPQYNGNISNQLWGPAITPTNTFTYLYDKLNRLTSGTATGMSESISYNNMGNITSLTRDGIGGTYGYNGNQLSEIIGGLATGSYAYDANGNAITDGRNNKTITYNLLNLPAAVSGGITYTYDARGQKLKKQSSTTIDYISGVQYQNNILDFVQTEEGIARRNGTSYNYEYNLKDHLGNTRVTFYKNPTSGSLEVLQRDDYYPFGLQKAIVANTNKYLYNGKEIQDELGQYDYGARFYDPVIARWNTIDPLAEKYSSSSPFNYVDNNPITRIDPDGRSWNSPIYGTDGKLLGTDDQGLKGKAIVMNEDKFEQGMSHEEALENNLGAAGLKDDKAKSSLLESYNGLKDRPDYDGHVNLDEANKWFREGNGQPLYVDLAKIDLSAISQSDFSKVGQRKYFQTLFNSDDGRVYGNIGLTLQSGGRVKGAYDDYDFDIKPYTKQTKITPAELIIRNAATGIGKALAGDGQGYRIYFNGTAPIKKK